MSQDWNIVDDSEDESPALELPPDDSRLDDERVRRIIRERRASDRIRLWRVGVIVTLLLASVIVMTRAIHWLAR